MNVPDIPLFSERRVHDLVKPGTSALIMIVWAVAWPATRRYFDDPQVAADTVGTRFFNPLVRIPLGTVLLEEALFRGVLLALALRRWCVATNSLSHLAAVVALQLR